MGNNYINKKYSEKCALLNNRLAQEILELNDEQIVRKTHYFAGRYENIYVDKNTIPELKTLVECAHQYAAEIVGRPREELKIGFWINIMQQGHTTTLHRHDDSDELLSCVYYVKVPEGSGEFVYQLNNEKHSVEPQEGVFLFFSPALLHEVTEHQSSEPRISIAFNVGPLEAEEDTLPVD